MLKRALCLSVVWSLSAFAASNDAGFSLANAIVAGDIKKANALLSGKAPIDLRGSIGSAALSRAFDKVIAYDKTMRIIGLDQRYADIARTLMAKGARSQKGFDDFYDHFKTAFREHKQTHDRFTSADAQQQIINFIHEAEDLAAGSENIPNQNHR